MPTASITRRSPAGPTRRTVPARRHPGTGYHRPMPRTTRSAPPSATPNDTDTLTPLQARVVREIVAHVRRSHLRAGEHLAESLLAEQIGTSRTPVNVALRHLAASGVLVHDHNRGYFLARDAASLDDVAERHSAEPDHPLYLRIAEDRLAGRLPDAMTEADLMRQYDCSRSVLRSVLSRVQQEGWIEKAVGHGWTFQPMIDSPQAYEESYLYRAAIEPTGLLAPGFTVDRVALGRLQREQRRIADGGWETMTAIELFQANSDFHETLALWSGNRFIVQSVRRMDQLRRLIEYRQARSRGPRREQALEHLQILEAITSGDLLRAASLMRSHLDGARRGKVHSRDVFTPPG